jgi:hypothetical protein
VEYIPGIIAYFTSGYLVWVSKTFIWKIADHWAKIWVGNAALANSQTLSLTSVITVLLVFGIAVFLWSLASHVNFKNTEKGFMANFAGALGLAIAYGQDSWLNEMAAQMTYAS